LIVINHISVAAMNQYFGNIIAKVGVIGNPVQLNCSAVQIDAADLGRGGIGHQHIALRIQAHA